MYITMNDYDYEPGIEGCYDCPEDEEVAEEECEWCSLLRPLNDENLCEGCADRAACLDAESRAESRAERRAMACDLGVGPSDSWND
jgi:hypothetical protein